MKLYNDYKLLLGDSDHTTFEGINRSSLPKTALRAEVDKRKAACEPTDPRRHHLKPTAARWNKGTRVGLIALLEYDSANRGYIATIDNLVSNCDLNSIDDIALLEQEFETQMRKQNEELQL